MGINIGSVVSVVGGFNKQLQVKCLVCSRHSINISFCWSEEVVEDVESRKASDNRINHLQEDTW